MTRSSRLQSLEWRLPLMNGSLLLVIAAALVGGAYIAVQQTTVMAATARLRNVAQQIAGLLEVAGPRAVVTAHKVADQEIIRAYLRTRDPKLRLPAQTALQNRAPNQDTLIAAELRDARGERLLAWGRANRVAFLGAPEVDRAIARKDSVGTVGGFRTLGDTVVYPVLAAVRDSVKVLGYFLEWRRQASATQTRAQINDLIGAGAQLLLGDTSQIVWTNLVQAVPGPPVMLVLGAGPAPGQVARYTRADLPEQFGLAVHARNTPWVALVEFPASVVLQPARAFLRSLVLIAVVVMMLGLLVAWFMSRSLTRPLSELASAADAIASGHHSRRVRADRDDELGQLAAAFNRMAEGFEHHHHQGEERFRLLVDKVRDYAIFALDVDGCVATWNAGAERLKGYSAGEITGRHFSTFYPPEDVKAGKPEREIREAIALGQVEDEGWRVRKDGSRFWANVVITPLRNPAGVLVGFTKVTRDMTKPKQAEEALRLQSNELARALTKLKDAQESLVRREKLAILGQLASGVGHELRNPLGVMTNAIYYLDTVMQNPAPKVREYVGILRHQIALSEKIVSDLLDFARVKPPQRAPVPLAGVVDEQMERVGRMDGVKVRLEMPKNLPPALADEVQVGQVVLNLLTNAVQAMGDRGGTLTVREALDGAGLLRLEVTDEGTGIAPENMDKIFEPLFTTKARGMGLGLAVSRALAVANGGDLTVTSPPGRGATFTLTLPPADLGNAA